eukprot:11890901-Heterocapsa_arctica.AAC.1
MELACEIQDASNTRIEHGMRAIHMESAARDDKINFDDLSWELHAANKALAIYKEQHNESIRGTAVIGENAAEATLMTKQLIAK